MDEFEKFIIEKLVQLTAKEKDVALKAWLECAKQERKQIAADLESYAEYYMGKETLNLGSFMLSLANRIKKGK